MALQNKFYVKKDTVQNLSAPDDVQWSYLDINDNLAIDNNGVLTTSNVIDLYDFNGRITLANSQELVKYINDGLLVGVSDDGVTTLSAEETLSKLFFITEKELENTIKNLSNQNALTESYKFSFASSQDNNAFFDDGNIELSWNAPAGYLELKMLTEPVSNGNLTSMLTFDGSTSSVFISEPNFTYRLNSSGLSSNNIMTLVVTSEEDATYPSYYLNVYNTSSLSHVVTRIEKVYLR